MFEQNPWIDKTLLIAEDNRRFPTEIRHFNGINEHAEQ